jgi:hypothetical protein
MVGIHDAILLRNKVAVQHVAACMEVSFLLRHLLHATKSHRVWEEIAQHFLLQQSSTLLYSETQKRAPRPVPGIETLARSSFSHAFFFSLLHYRLLFFDRG